MENRIVIYYCKLNKNNILDETINNNKRNQVIVTIINDNLKNPNVLLFSK